MNANGNRSWKVSKYIPAAGQQIACTIRQCWHPYAIALFIAAVHFALRLHVPNYIFDDTRHIYEAFVASGGHASSIGLSDLLDIIRRQFTDQSPREYRPLSFIQHELILRIYGPSYTVRPIILMIIVSLGWGALAGFHFAFARRILGRPLWALLATLIFITAMPILTGSWILAMGWQWVVSLCIIAGLLCYQNYKADSRRLWLIFIILITVIGSWFREYSGLFVFLALANELLFERKRSLPVIAVLAVSAFHVMFPAFLANILFLGGVSRIALTPVYDLGPIGRLSHDGQTLFHLSSLRWDALYHFVLLFPPLLWLLAAVSVNVTRWPFEQIFVLSDSVSARLRSALTSVRAHRLFGIIFAFSVLIAARGIVHDSYALAYVAGTFAAFLLAAAYVLPISPLLVLYGILSFLPFLKIYLHEVHLAYSVAPFAIILTAMVVPIWDWARARSLRFMHVPVAPIVGGILAVVGIDNLLNVEASVQAVNAVYHGAAERGRWLHDHVPKSAIVVGNFLDLRDTLLYAPRHFQPYFSVPAGWEPNHVETGAKFLAMLDEELPHTPVYLLGSVFPRNPGKYSYHHLHYLTPVEYTSPVRHVFETRVLYPYADPLKYFIPANLTSYPGPPDLVDDYHVGRERKGSLFVREFYANYLLLQVGILDEQQRTAILHSKDDAGIVDVYRGFNMFRLEETAIGEDMAGRPVMKGAFVAFDQNAGPINPHNLTKSSNYQACAAKGRCFTGPSIQCLRYHIDQLPGSESAYPQC